MKALSVQQPWADFILRGKDVENRSWPTSYRGALLIHAGMKLRQGPWLRAAYGPDHEWELGGIVGIVDLVDCVQGYKSPWAGNGGGSVWHWVLANPRRVPFVPLKGKLQLFEVPWPPEPNAVGKTHRRDERPFSDVDALFKPIVAIEEVARVLPLASLRAVVAAVGEAALPTEEREAREAFAQRFRTRLNTVLTRLGTEERHLLLGAAGLSTRQSINAWAEVLGGVPAEEMADDPTDSEIVGADGADGEVDEDDEGDEDDEEDGFIQDSIEVVKELGIQREEGWLYYFDDGNIMRGPADSDEDAFMENAELVVATGIQSESGFLYFLDKKGDLRRGRPRPTPRVADVLDWIGVDCGRDALALLCDRRGVPRRKSKYHMAWQLARSYRGDMAALVNDLRCEDLAALFGSEEGVEIEERWWRLEAADAKPLEVLREIAIAVLVNADTSGLALSEVDDEEDEDEDEHEDDEDDSEVANGPAPAAQDDVSILKERLGQYTGRRTVEIRSLLKKAGLGEFARLRTDRFQELRGLVEAAGYVLCDADGAAFTSSDESPGIGARVLVLPRGEAAAANTTSAALVATPAPAPAPSSVTAAAPVLAAAAPSAVSDYELAIARLRVLTAAPWPERRSSAFWPNEFIQLACDKPLDDGQRRLLTLMCEKLVGGTHDAEGPLALLRGAQDRGRLAALADGFELLNDGAPNLAALTSGIRNRLGLS